MVTGGGAPGSASDELMPCCEKKLVRLSTMVESHILYRERSWSAVASPASPLGFSGPFWLSAGADAWAFTT